MTDDETIARQIVTEALRVARISSSNARFYVRHELELQARERCCPDATRVYDCACSRSYTCPTHGRTCYGSHD